jgi:hypothetical protein
MEHKIRIDTSVYGDGRIVQSLTEKDIFSGLERKILTQVIDSQEAHVRESLIKLGWTPPKKEGLQ